MDVRALILKTLSKKGEVRAAEIVKATGFSRVYVNRFFRELKGEGVLALVGKANKARYIPASGKLVEKARSEVKKVHRILSNRDLNEDKILAEIKNKTGIFKGLPGNVSDIFDYAFTEMLNNAIEHSKSDKIEVWIEKKKRNIVFKVKDKGVGIYNNIIRKKKLNNEMEAIQDLLKGKETTEPASHSGEGIFFTSKVGDILTIESSRKKLTFNNLVEDVFLDDINKKKKGTRVIFSISPDSDRKIGKVFRDYTDDSYSFSKTKVTVKLYDREAGYVSRSQARRLLSGLEKFKTVILDFKGVDSVGQAFADEVFRVWKNAHPGKKIMVKNAGKNVIFMVKRAGS